MKLEFDKASAEREMDRLILRYKFNFDTIYEWFHSQDFLVEGGITPFQFNQEEFVKLLSVDEPCISTLRKEIITKIGMLFSVVYANTDAEGNNSTLEIKVFCERCGDMLFEGEFQEWENLEDNRCFSCEDYVGTELRYAKHND